MLPTSLIYPRKRLHLRCPVSRVWKISLRCREDFFKIPYTSAVLRLVGMLRGRSHPETFRGWTCFLQDRKRWFRIRQNGNRRDAFGFKTFSVVSTDGVGGGQRGRFCLFALLHRYWRGVVGEISSVVHTPTNTAWKEAALPPQNPALVGNKSYCAGNIGDTGAIVVRQVTIVSTTAQRHDFNCPFQLGFHDFILKRYTR